VPAVRANSSAIDIILFMIGEPPLAIFVPVQLYKKCLSLY
jgi:hypothetical protein